MPESFLATNIKALFNHATEFFCIINSNLVYEYVNPSHIRLFSGRDLTGLSIEAAQPELKNTEFVPTLRKILQTGETVQYEEIAVQIGTEVRYLNMLYAPRRNYSGVVDGIYALGSDITEKVFALKQVRQALKEADLARNDLHELFMQAPFPICFLSGPDYVFTMVNPEYMKYIQRQVEDRSRLSHGRALFTEGYTISSCG